jgi:hypothetical protein
MDGNTAYWLEDAQAGEAGMHDVECPAWEDEKIVRFLSSGRTGGLRDYFFELLAMLPLPEAGVEP